MFGRLFTAQGLQENLGLASRTQDADFDAACKKLDGLTATVTTLRGTLESYAKALTETLPRLRGQNAEVMLRLSATYVPRAPHFEVFSAVLTSLDSQGEEGKGGAGAKAESPKGSSAKAESGQQSLAQKQRGNFKAAVLDQVDAWLASLAAAKAGNDRLRKAHQEHDHYMNKLAALKRAKDTLLASGKVVPKDEDERLRRNEEKFKAVRGWCAASAGVQWPLRTRSSSSHPPPPPPYSPPAD